MTARRTCRIFLLALIMPLLSCQFLGPTAIKWGRLNYNDVIQQTSKTQTFANIIRVKNHEPTAFLDVTQISAAVLAQANLTGAVSSLGVHPQNGGSASLGLEYQEAPTIQYNPLLGQALITQIATPITIDSITNLYDSDWLIAPLIALAVDRLTPGYEDFAAALNAIIALDDLGAITFTPGVVSTTLSDQGKPASAASKPSTSEQEPVLIVALQAVHPRTNGAPTDIQTAETVSRLWCRLYTLLNGNRTRCEEIPKTIAFSRRQVPIKTETSHNNKRELSANSEYPLRTRSALGILKSATETPSPRIAFVTEEIFRKIRGHPWNSRQVRSACGEMIYYTLLPEEEGPEDHPSANVEATRVVRNLIMSREQYPERSPKWCLYTTSSTLDPTDYQGAQDEARLAFLRRYLLIIVSDSEIEGSYVSYSDGKKWYSIDADDDVSQKNFVLIGQFLTMQATTVPQSPLVPTISVGPSR